MLRKTGFFSSFAAAALLAVAHGAPARADIAPAAPIEAAEPASGIDAALLSAKLARAGMPADEARSFAASLDAGERAFVADRADSAEVGGFIAWIAVLLTGAVVIGVGWIIHTVKGEPTEPATPPAPDAAPAAESGSAEPSPSAPDADAE